MVPVAYLAPFVAGYFYTFLLLSQDHWRYGYLGIIAERCKHVCATWTKCQPSDQTKACYGNCRVRIR